ncbi:Serine/threonine-protein kinase US3 [Fulvia fulva]|nr:Serine/threonine-protein kinase US3 [Fulvia fulva]
MTYLHEGAELVAESGRTYLAVDSLGQDNVWIGAEKGKDDHVVILKSPGPDDAPGVWPKFQQEMTMHELFKDCPTIREQVDRIAPDDSGSPPILVLEMIATTVWMARKKRPFTRSEIFAIVRGLLESLRDVHAKGLVYSDIKMPNIMLGGFENNNPSDGSDLTVKLGDLGEVMYPSSGTAQPIAYRAPEVFFKGEIGPASDIWAVGLVLSHLLEAQTHFSETGLYNDLFHEDSTADQSAQVLRSAISNDYDLKNTECYQGCALPFSKGADHVNRWDGLRERLSPADVAFLEEIMKADPRERPTAASLLQHPWFKNNDAPSDYVSQVEASADDGMKDTESAQGVDGNLPQAPQHTLPNSHAPIEFQSINESMAGKEMVVGTEPSRPTQTIASDKEKAPQDAANSSYAPIEFQSIDESAIRTSVEANDSKPEAHPGSDAIPVAAPQLSPVRAFSPIIFQDIHTIGVPNDFSDEAVSRISNAQKRLSARGVNSVQLNNQPLVDSKHKRESIHFRPISVGSASGLGDA